MAGKGTRFQRLNLDIPKPFIKVLGEPLFLKATISWRTFFHKSNFTFVIQDEALGHFQPWFPLLDSKIKSYRLVRFSRVTSGPLESAIRSIAEISDKESVLFQDCDCYLENSKLVRYLCREDSRKEFGAVSTFPSSKERYSYVKLNAQHQVVAAAEKKVISDSAIGGAYYFSQIGELRDYYDKIAKGPPVGEPVLSEVVNRAVLDKKVIKAFLADKFISIGTANEYLEAKKLGVFHGIPKFESV